MPILPKEPDTFPAELFTSPAIQAAGTDWWAAYTLSRREKELLRRLRVLNIPHYCPTVTKKWRSPAGRVRTSQIPLFPGYVFMQADADQRQSAIKTNCISRTLPVSNSQELLADLGQIWQLIESEVALTQESRIQPGQSVRVISGPLQGVEGTVIRREGREHLLVSVQFLQQGASVLIEDFQVESI